MKFTNIRYFVFISIGVICLLAANYAKGDNAMRDSLKSILSQEIEVADRLSILNQLAEEFGREKPHECLKYAQEAEKLAKLNGFLLERGTALNHIAKAEMFIGNNRESIKFAEEARNMAKENGFEVVSAEAYHNLGLNYQMLGNYAESLMNYEKALDLNKGLNRVDKQLHQLNNIAIVRRDLKDYDVALDYLKEAAILAEDRGNKRLLVYNKINIGYIYLDLKDYEKSLTYIKPNISACEELKDTLGLSIMKNILGQVYLGLEDYDAALKFSEDAVVLAESVPYKDGIINALHTSCEILYQKKDYANSIERGERALSLADSLTTTRYIEGTLTTLINSYKAIGDKDAALKYQTQLIKVKEKIFGVEQDRLVYKLDVDHRIEEQERENEGLKRKLELDDKIIQQQKYLNVLAWCLASLFLLFCFGLYRSLQSRRVQGEKLELAVDQRTKELKHKNEDLIVVNNELQKMSYMTSHDLKQPLLNIETFTKLLDEKIDEKDERKELTQFILSGTQELTYLIKSIIDYSSVNQFFSRESTRIDLNAILKKTKNSLKTQLEEKNMEVVSSNLPLVTGNAELFEKLFVNLLKNAMKFNDKDNPKVEISFEERNEFYKFSFSDNGMGVPLEFQDSIFEMFKRLNNNNEFKGSGLGLTICKKIINLYGGKIWVESQEGQGTIFKFTLKAE